LDTIQVITIQTCGNWTNSYCLEGESHATALGNATGSLGSGGSRRETRNLFLGNKIRYSGSVTIEVLIIDVDGMLQASEII